MDGMAEAFAAMRLSRPDGVAGRRVRSYRPRRLGNADRRPARAPSLIPDASWPIDTELENKVSRPRSGPPLNIGVDGVHSAAIKRPQLRSSMTLSAEMRPVIRERLLYFWCKGIRGADFFISAIGPALSVFGRHTRVMYPDGTDVGVRDFLDLVRRESTEVALEQVLGGADLGQLDSLTRQYVTWVWSYSRAPLDAGEAIALCLATGADYGEVVREGSIAAEVKEKSKKMVKLRTIKERGDKEDELGISNGARPVPLIDELQHAAHLWFQNRPEQLVALPRSRSAKHVGQHCAPSARPSPSASLKAMRTAASFTACSAATSWPPAPEMTVLAAKTRAYRAPCPNPSIHAPCGVSSRSNPGFPPRARTMTQSNHSALGEGLKLYAGAMRRYVKERLINAYPETWWESGVIKALGDQQRNSIKRDMEKSPDKEKAEFLEPVHFQVVIGKNQAAFKEHFGDYRKWQSLLGQVATARIESGPPN